MSPRLDEQFTGTPLLLPRRQMLAGCVAMVAFTALPAMARAADPLQALRVRVAAGPPTTYPATAAVVMPRQRALFIEGAPWKGKPSRAFALIGMPAAQQGSVPGIVLVHGGGGTAYAEWVRRWTDAGFAAIAVAVSGQTDAKAPEGSRERWLRHDVAGPPQLGIYSDSAEPIEDQWIFHAQWSVIAAHSLLAATPGVDPKRIGLAGISWGSVIVQNVIGIDPRPAFAILIYGGGFMNQLPNRFGVLRNNKQYLELWEPSLRLSAARMPTLWLIGRGEHNASLVTNAKTYAFTRGPRMISVVPDLKHNHPAGWQAPESYAFARSVVQNGKPWAEQIDAAGRAGARARVVFRSSEPLQNPVLMVATGRGHSVTWKWIETPAQMTRAGDRYTLTGKVPLDATAWMFTASSGGSLISSVLKWRADREAETAGG